MGDQGRQNVTLRAPEMGQKVQFTHHLARRSQRKWLDLLGRISAHVCGVEIFKLSQRLATKIELAAPQEHHLIFREDREKTGARSGLDSVAVVDLVVPLRT